VAQKAYSGQGHLTDEVSISHTQLDTPHSVGLLCTSDRSVAETIQTQHTTNIHALSDPSKFERMQTYEYVLDRTAIGIDPEQICVLREANSCRHLDVTVTLATGICG